MELLPQCLALSSCCINGASEYGPSLEESDIRGEQSSVWQPSRQEVRGGLERPRGCLGVPGKGVLRRRWRLSGGEKFGGVWGAVKNDFS